MRVWIGLWLALLIVQCLAVEEEVKFIMPQTGSKCFHDRLPMDSEVKFEILASEGTGNLNLDFFVTRMLGGTMLTSRRSVKHDIFSLRTPPAKGPKFKHHHTNDERFRFCFLNNGKAMGEPSRRKIIFKYKAGAAAKELVTKKKEEGREAIRELEDSIEHAADIFDEIADDIETMMQQETELYEYTTSTSRNVLIYSVFSCVFLLLTGVYRVYATKTFFKNIKAV